MCRRTGCCEQATDAIKRGCLADIGGADLELSLWLFHGEDSRLRCVAGTYPADSKAWSKSFPWGFGFRGMAMRRARLEWYARSEGRYPWPGDILDGPKPEAYLLCVPFPLPVGREFPQGPVEFCRLIACLSSCDMASGMSKLRNVENRGKVASLVFFEVEKVVRSLGQRT